MPVAQIPQDVVDAAVELRKVLGTPEGAIFLRALEKQVVHYLTLMLSKGTTDDEAVKYRHQAMGILDLIDRQVLNEVRLAEAWIRARQKQMGAG